MTTVSSNRSPSPISNMSDPNSRTPEINSSKPRRSFSGNPMARPSILTNPKNFNPVTPANSPAEFGRRHSTGKGGSAALQGYREKENEKDPNVRHVKVRSPAMVKGTKNFMSPTISAASKINASPRKKVLTEANDSVCSFADGKCLFGLANLLDVSEEADPKSEMGSSRKKIVASTFSESDQKDTLLTSHMASSSSSETITVDSDCLRDVDTISKINPAGSSMSPITAPPDADTSLPPYDPKTNFLSPRPQFLHYRPKSRPEALVDEAKGLYFGEGRQLEDSFESENLSDTDISEETQSEDSQKESEEASSADMETKEEQEEPQTTVPEPNPTTASISTDLSHETVVEAKMVSKPRFFLRSKFVCLLLFLVVACLSVSVTDSPVIDSVGFKDLSFPQMSDPTHIALFAKAKFDGFSRNFKHLSNHLSHLSRLIRILGGVDELGPLQFANLTALQEDFLADGYLSVDYSERRSDQSNEQDELATAAEGEIEASHQGVEADEGTDEVSEGYTELELEEIEPLEDQSLQEFEADDSNEEASEEYSDPEMEVQLTLESKVMETDSSESIQIQEQSDSAFHIDSETQGNDASNDQTVLIPQPQPEVVEIGEFNDDNDCQSCAETESAVPEAHLESSSSEADPSSRGIQSLVDALRSSIQSLVGALRSSTQELDYKLSVYGKLGISLLVLAPVAAMAFISSKTGKTTTPNVLVPVEPLLTKKLISSSVSHRIEHSYQHGTVSQNCPTEVDIVGESCPSEMSSFQKSSSYSKKGAKGANEAQSQERRQRKNSRRESFASSSSEFSLGSTAYGSFTTYEKIPSSKPGCGDEETVTPVRRSSRIRNQVTSP